jgi:hypothetical protein
MTYERARVRVCKLGSLCFKAYTFVVQLS